MYRPSSAGLHRGVPPRPGRHVVLLGAVAGTLLLHACAAPVTVAAPEALRVEAPEPTDSSERVDDASRGSLDAAPRAGHGDALLHAFSRARPLVERATATSLDGVSLSLVDDVRIDEAVRRETYRLVVGQFDSPRFTEDFVERVMRSQSGTYAALYVPRDEAILVSETALDAFMRATGDGRGDGPGDAAIRDAALLALMIHELVHAADDHRHDIEQVRALDFRAAFAQSAVFEGHAQHQTRRLCQRVGCLAGLEALDRFMFGDATTVDPVLQSSAALSRNVLEYAYVEGERFIDALAQGPDGAAGLMRLLDSPPRDPIQILDPGSWPNAAREARNRRLMAAATDAAARWPSADTNPDAPLRWSAIEVSPLKGVNLRHDPARRRAAIDGFTRLLVAMAAIELHDERDIARLPIAVTLLSAESPETAKLFARTLHGNNVAVVSAVRGAHSSRSEAANGTLLLRTSSAGRNDPDAQRTLVGVRDRTIVQIAASAVAGEALDAYALAVFEALSDDGTGPSALGLSPSSRGR